LEQLLEEAAHTTDRARRLAMYREADRILVNEEVVVCPLAYAMGGRVELAKPWVKGLRGNALGNYSLKDIVIEPHG
jgi:ABC-type oligopeptide transport system substrate-binding subunit